MREDHRNTRGPSGALDGIEPGEWRGKDITVEEEDGGQRLILGGGGDVAVARQVLEKASDLLSAHLSWVTKGVKDDELADPGDVCSLGAVAVVADAHEVSGLVEKFWHVMTSGVGLVEPEASLIVAARRMR